jgi:hypothetical protein
MKKRRMAGTFLAALALMACAMGSGAGYFGSGHEAGQGAPAGPPA